MKTTNTYKLISHLLDKLIIWSNEDEAILNEENKKLSYKNSKYIITGSLSGDEFEYEFIVDGDSLELDEPDQEIIFRRLEKEIEEERIHASREDMSDTYDFINSNFFKLY